MRQACKRVCFQDRNLQVTPKVGCTSKFSELVQHHSRIATRFTSRERGLLHLTHGGLDHGEMFLERWKRFGRPSFHVTIIPALCLSLELSNVIFVVHLKQFQILPVERSEERRVGKE